MLDLASQDTHALLHCIHTLYSFRDPETFGRDTLTLLEQLTPCPASVRVTHPSAYTAATYESLCPDFERLLAVDLRETIEKHMYQITFFEGLALASQGENKCHKFSDFVTREQMWQLEGNQIIFAAIPYDDQMVMMIEGEVNLRDPFTYYTLYRSWGEWSDRDRLLLNLFHPHLVQAYHTVLHWQRQQHQINDLKESLDSTGVIFLTPKGDAHAITRQASEWLRLYFPGVQSPSRLPETLQGWVSHQINQIYCTEPYPALLPLRIQQSDRQLIIRFTIDQFKKSYLLLLAEEQPLSPLASLELLGLSKREAEIMLGVLQGQDNKAIAQTLPITLGTVRKHLENIYRKLNVQSRSEAIALVVQKLGGLNSPPLTQPQKTQTLENGCKTASHASSAMAQKNGATRP